MLRINEIPRYPNDIEAKRSAYEFIHDNIGKISYPLNPDIFFTDEMHILPWTEACAINNAKDFFNLKSRKAEARTRKIRGTDEYLTIYDDTLPNKDRIKFTKAHELGHIVLGHFDKYEETALNRGGLTSKKYKVLESEADHFAAQLITPTPLIILLNLYDPARIRDLFSVSWKVAVNRIIDIQRYGKSPIYKDAMPMFQKLFTEQLALYQIGYKCKVCSNYSTKYSKITPFCPVCGFNALIKVKDIQVGERDVMKYKGVKTTDDGKPLLCPRCENEELDGGDYCKICGLYILNRCTQIDGYNDIYGGHNSNSWIPPCGVVADGNARYCCKCGSETTYFRDGLLSSWDKTKTYN